MFKLNFNPLEEIHLVNKCINKASRHTLIYEYSTADDVSGEPLSKNRISVTVNEGRNRFRYTNMNITQAHPVQSHPFRWHTIIPNVVSAISMPLPTGRDKWKFRSDIQSVFYISGQLYSSQTSWDRLSENFLIVIYFRDLNVFFKASQQSHVSCCKRFHNGHEIIVVEYELMCILAVICLAMCNNMSTYNI